MIENKTETLKVIKDSNPLIRKTNKLEGNILHLEKDRYDTLALNMNYRALALMTVTSLKDVVKRGRRIIKSIYIEQDDFYLTKDFNLTQTESALYDVLLSILFQKKNCNTLDLESNKLWIDKVKNEGVIILDSEFFEYLGFDYDNEKTQHRIFDCLYYLSRTTIFLTKKPIEYISEIDTLGDVQSTKLIYFDYGYTINDNGRSQYSFEVKIPTYRWINGVSIDKEYKTFNEYNTGLPREVIKTIFREPRVYWIARYIQMSFLQRYTNGVIKVETLIEKGLGDTIDEIRREFKKPENYFRSLTNSIKKAFKYFPDMQLELTVDLLGLRNYKDARIICNNIKELKSSKK